jgi:hypothetical protein
MSPISTPDRPDAAGDAVPRDLLDLSDTLRKELAGLPAHVVKRKIRDTLDEARLLMGARARAGELGLTDEIKGRLVREAKVTQRYRRMCARLGWDMHLHQLRHFSATELIASVDIRTVAGRLGHGGGGTTTLRVYSAWVGAARLQRLGWRGRSGAADSLTGRLPSLPGGTTLTPGEAAALPISTRDPESPYQQIAADLHAAIRCGNGRRAERDERAVTHTRTEGRSE